MDARQIEQVRRFNRVVTRRVGALDDSYLSRGRPLGEARLLFEIGSGGADVGALRARLGLNSGYLSRLLRSLEAQDLIRVHGQSGDRRRRRASPTPQGQAELATYNELSDALATSFLTPLGPDERERLVAAMAEVERLIRSALVEVRREAPTSAASRWCLAEYFRELAQRFEIGFDPERSNSARPEELRPPAGYFFVAWLDGRPAGCGALKVTGKSTGEIKRMWTAPAARGLGIARRILRTLEEKAREADLDTLRLETSRTLREAQGLYRQEGYQEVPAFNDEPYADHWFEKRL
jgi:DNA-binding MarR family transcriptional regulator/GNAT superfamily N-acetyltransferase